MSEQAFLRPNLSVAGALVRLSLLCAVLVATQDGELSEQIRLVCVLFTLASVSARPLLDVCAIGLPLLAFEPFGLGPWIGVVFLTPLLFRVATINGSAATLLATLHGASYAIVLTPWIARDAPVPWLVEAVYVVLGAALMIAAILPARLVLSRLGYVGVPVAAFWLTFVEWGRSHAPEFPTPYHLAGHALADNPWLVQLGTFGGALGLSLLVAAISSTFAVAALSKGPNRTAGIFAGLTLIAVAHATGAVLANTTDKHQGVVLRVACIKAGGMSYAAQTAEYNRLLRLALREPDLDMIILPEGAVIVPDNPDSVDDSDPLYITKQALEQLLAEHPGHPDVVTGLIHTAGILGESPLEFRDSIAVFRADGTMDARDKMWFSPVEERRPFAMTALLKPVGGLLTRSRFVPVVVSGGGSLEIAGQTAAVCICLDSMIPDLWRHKVPAGPPSFLLAIANVNGLRGSTVQHRQSRPARILHAIEQRRPFIYVTTHRAEWISPLGETHDISAREDGLIVMAVPLPIR